MTRRLAAGCLVLAALAVAAQPATAKPKRKVQHSHLEIGPVRLGTDHALKNEATSAISVCAHIVNAGKGASSRGAELIMSLLGPDGSNEIVARHGIGQIRGIKPAAGRGHHPHRYSDDVCARGTSATLAVPLGAYGVQVCAEDSNSTGKDSCHFCKGKCFFVGKRAWSGTASGTQTSQAENESWQTGAVTYTLNSYGPPGQFTYKLSGGAVNYQVTATRSFCTLVGGGTLTANAGELRVDYQSGGYDVYGDVPTDGTVPATVNCPGVSTSEDSSVQSRFIDDGPDPSALPPFGGEEKLANAFSQGLGIASLQYHWDLR